MNSALQCIINLEVINKIAFNEKLEDMINKDNPLGSKGALLKALCFFMKNYY